MSRRSKRHRWFRVLTPRVRPVVRAMARHLSEGDRDLADDLEQEGLIAVYLMDPRELAAHENPEGAAIGRATRAMHRGRRRLLFSRPVPDGREVRGVGVVGPRRRR